MFHSTIFQFIIKKEYLIDESTKLEQEKQKNANVVASILPQHIISKILQTQKKEIEKAKKNKKQGRNIHVLKKPHQQSYYATMTDGICIYCSIFFRDGKNDVCLDQQENDKKRKRNANGNEEKVKPQEREFINSLHTVFSLFDNLIDHFGFIKIKSVLNNYLVIRDSHYSDPNEIFYSLESRKRAFLSVFKLMKKFLELGDEYNFDLRFGVKLGPITTGILGTSKIFYDAISKTINLSQRFSYTTKLNSLQCTKEFVSILEEFGILDEYEYQYEIRQNIFIKGKGDMNLCLFPKSTFTSSSEQDMYVKNYD